ncbi:MAG: acyl-CoA dehydrogenase family protein [Anaerolineae bacterium]|jgi:hypothetical protein|nr:acyl-CoA dehydrogenase family protein [Anaerolineae bacterium]
MTHPQIAQGRVALRAWQAAKPDNFFSADPNLQRVLQRALGDPAYQAFEQQWRDFGGHCATTIDHAAKIEDRIAHHPRLERWSALGDRMEAIEFHPYHDTIGALIWESGLMALQATPGNIVRQMGLYYLLGHNGEAGHACSLACTAGLIRVLQRVADPMIRDQFLPPLLERDYQRMQHGAQFLTEVQGGSDVGGLGVQATLSDGQWRINGEKWFCSNINADQFLILARVPGQGDGTRGLGMFLIPRRLEDGATNGFYLRRLKDKLGTRTLASAEVDFQDALAYPLGPTEHGFKNAVEWVLNTSRLMNAVACAGIMQRAYLEASRYACYRQAFGQAILTYPLVQEAIADIASENAAAVASSFALAGLVDAIDLDMVNEDQRGAYRLLVNLNKYITSIRGTECVHRAIEVLGGNGAIESFSILPRLYRDLIVLESWEGTHNVLCAQVWRDLGRYQLHLPYVRWLHEQIAPIHDPRLADDRAAIEQACITIPQWVDRLQAGGERYAQAHMRRLVDHFAHTGQAALLLAEAQWELERGLTTLKPDLTTYFINRHLRPGYDPIADTNYVARLARIAAL